MTPSEAFSEFFDSLDPQDHWKTMEEACKFLEVDQPKLEELIVTGQLDVGGSAAAPLILGKSLLTYDRLRKRLG